MARVVDRAGRARLIALRGRWPALVDLLRRSVRDWRLLIALPVSAALLGVQLWLFLWAPLHAACSKCRSAISCCR